MILLKYHKKYATYYQYLNTISTLLHKLDVLSGRREQYIAMKDIDMRSSFK